LCLIIVFQAIDQVAYFLEYFFRDFLALLWIVLIDFYY
jgi:hypothetical protein